MIALLSGNVAVRRGDHVVIECGGVGYRVAVSAQTLRKVPAVGHQTVLHTHMVVRDDALALYGFATEEERSLFLMLLGVQSVGPKVALAVLSGGPPRDLLSAVAAGDTARLQAVPGIGKRANDCSKPGYGSPGVTVPFGAAPAPLSNSTRTSGSFS